MASKPKEYYQLSVMGKEIHDYWKMFLYIKLVFILGLRILLGAVTLIVWLIALPFRR